MNCKQKLFLDNTIQIDRLFETSDRKQMINKELAESECYTCTLVLREFKFRVIDTCISLLHIIEECNSDPDVLTTITHNKKFSKNLQTMLVKIYAEVKREAGLQNFYDKELALETLRAYITGRLLLRFRDILTEPESDLTSCDVARYEFQEFNGMFEIDTHCERKEARCDLPKIYQNNEDHLKRTKEIFENQSVLNYKLNKQEKTEFERINEVYSGILDKEDWNIVKGWHNCDKLADFTILIESLDGSSVYTTDNIYKCFYDRLYFQNKNAPKIQKYP
jgi:hypothetical protein